MANKIINHIYCDICGAEISFEVATSNKNLTVIMENLKEIEIDISPDLDLCTNCAKETLDRARDSL